VIQDTYEEIYFGAAMQSLAANGVAECLAGCQDCAFVPYCGADPVRHYATQHDAYGHRPSSSFCQKNKAIFEFLFDKLQSMDMNEEEIIWTWLRNCAREDVVLNGMGKDYA
jgi:sarcosine oxidase delta subunit